MTIVTRPTAAQDPNHPSTGDCGTCHSSTTSFTTGVTGKPANHIPTTQTCTLCHTSLPGSYKPGVMNHSGHQQRLHDVSRGGSDRDGVLRRDAAAAGKRAHPDQCRLRDVSRVDDQVRSRHADAAHRHHERLCHVPRHRQVLYRRDQPEDEAGQPRAYDRACEACHAASKFTSFAGTAMNHTGISSGCTTCHAAGATGTAFFGVTPLPQGCGSHPDQRGLRDLSRVDVQVRSRHADEPHAGGGNAVRDLSRDGQELHRRDHRHAADGGTGCGASADRRLRDLPQLDHLVHDRSDRQAGESHSDDAGVHAVSHEPAGLLQAGGDEPRRHQQRLHDVSRGRGDRDAVLRRDAAAAGMRATSRPMRTA